MGKLMFQFRNPQGPPSLDEVRRQFGFNADEVDPQFGVVTVDPEDHLYVVLVDESAQRRVSKDKTSASGDEATGSFSNPKIEPFGPPETE